MSNKKTNIDYLRDMLDKNMGEPYKDEDLEFLESIEDEVKELEKQVDDKNDEIKSLESDIDEKQTEINSLENDGPNWEVIQAGIGTIEWYSDNIQLQGLMEALEEKLKTSSPNSIAALLEK
jgi:chromosome segregation ATPase